LDPQRDLSSAFIGIGSESDMDCGDVHREWARLRPSQQQIEQRPAIFSTGERDKYPIMWGEKPMLDQRAGELTG